MRPFQMAYRVTWSPSTVERSSKAAPSPYTLPLPSGFTLQPTKSKPTRPIWSLTLGRVWLMPQVAVKGAM